MNTFVVNQRIKYIGSNRNYRDIDCFFDVKVILRDDNKLIVDNATFGSIIVNNNDVVRV